MPFKLISINIECSKHLERVIPFLQREQADIVCIQELMERDVAQFESALGTQAYFEPKTQMHAGVEGMGIFTKHRVLSRGALLYAGESALRNFDETSATTKHATQRHPILFCDIEVDGRIVRICTTHFTWTPDGLPDDLQRADIVRFLRELSAFPEFILCGDFNAPRGGEIFAQLARAYTDNIPPHYLTSIDVALHRAGKERPHELADKMVDGLFTTPGYRASDVVLVDGVSDHMAIVATIDQA